MLAKAGVGNVLSICMGAPVGIFQKQGRFAETPMDGETKLMNFLAHLPWEDAMPESMEQVQAILRFEMVTRVSHFAHFDVKNIRSDITCRVRGGAVCGM